MTKSLSKIFIIKHNSQLLNTKQKEQYEWVSDWFLTQNEHFSAISWPKQVTFDETMSALY